MIFQSGLKSPRFKVSTIHVVCNIYKVLYSCSSNIFHLRCNRDLKEKQNEKTEALHPLGIPTTIPDNSDEDEINSDQGLLLILDKNIARENLIGAVYCY